MAMRLERSESQRL